MNPYEVLGINSDSTIEEVEKAYRLLVKKYHPDLNQTDPNASKKFKEIQTSYELVKKLKKSNNPFEGVRFNTKSGFNDFDINVNDFFSGSVFKGMNIQSKIELSLKEVLTGCKKELKIKRRSVCSTCSGQGFSDFVSCEGCKGTGVSEIRQPPFTLNRPCKFCDGSGKTNVRKCTSCSGKGYSSYEERNIEVTILPGVEHGSQIKLEGEGEISLKGGKSGDLIVLVSVKSDPLFKREGSHINLEVPVSYSQLVLGCDIIVPCITDEKIILKVPPSTQPSTKFRIKGKGLPYRGIIGDMVVFFKLEVPKEIDEKYKECIKSLSFFEEKYITCSRKKWAENFN